MAEFTLCICEKCREILPERGENIVECQECNRKLCLDCCEADFSDEASENGTWGLCQYCTGNDATDEQLLSFAAKKLSMSVEDLKKQYLKEFVLPDEEE